MPDTFTKILAIACGALGLVVFGLLLYCNNLGLRLDAAKARGDSAIATNTALKSAADQCQIQVDNLLDEQVKLRKRAAAAIAEAEKAKNSSLQRVGAILSYKGSGNQCEDANALLSTYLKGGV